MSTDSTDGVAKGVPEVDSAPFLQANAAAKSRYGRFNLAIIGGTGVGKSSLVNAVFGREQARVGKGLPVTSGIHYYHDESLGIWDFEGFEIGSSRSPGETLRAHLDTISRRPPEEQISVVWYCVLSTADRLTQPDVDMIRALGAAGLPVVLVLTKVAWTKNPLTGSYRPPHDVALFRDWLEAPTDANGAPLHLPLHRVVLTAAQGANGKGTGHGLGELVAETLALSPDSEKDAFRIAQRLNLPWKREMARPVIAAAAASAAATAAIPLPIADAAALAPIQMSMMGRIAAIYDLEFTSVLPASALAQFGAQVAGQALARSFVKLIPGVGSAVNATVAFSLTSATGEGWLRLCEQIHTGRVNVTEIPGVWAEFSPSLVSVVKHLVEQRARKR
ncbi:GTPase family protein [Leucobacter sp. M11]|uniref:GTPase family protein n=1 Tax=Leucobacter sp. M11 TaxID=2993565 RepID=UPI002D7ED154|nr:DUF697 domain-containing protein [Leucobacter sp. M11]MEB4614939.1 DUF697 domain-containing protein [Leucobacter sp. M11]